MNLSKLWIKAFFINRKVGNRIGESAQLADLTLEEFEKRFERSIIDQWDDDDEGVVSTEWVKKSK